MRCTPFFNCAMVVWCLFWMAYEFFVLGGWIGALFGVLMLGLMGWNIWYALNRYRKSARCVSCNTWFILYTQGSSHHCFECRVEKPDPTVRVGSWQGSSGTLHSMLTIEPNDAKKAIKAIAQEVNAE